MRLRPTFTSFCSNLIKYRVLHRLFFRCYAAFTKKVQFNCLDRTAKESVSKQKQKLSLGPWPSQWISKPAHLVAFKHFPIHVPKVCCIVVPVNKVKSCACVLAHEYACIQPLLSYAETSIAATAWVTPGTYQLTSVVGVGGLTTVPWAHLLGIHPHWEIHSAMV